MRWWNKQDPSARAEVERTKDFEAILSTMREPDELESILLSTTSGPEDAKLISPDGLFRLVLRCQKSENAKKFHEWVQDIEAKEAAKNKPPPSDDDDSDDDMAALFGRFGGGKKKDKEEILPNELPKVKDIWEDFASRNLLFNIATNDDWFFARKDAVSDLAKAGLLASNELKIYTLEMASNPEYLCVKGYLKFAVPPKTISDCLWPESKTNKPGGRAVWDPLHKKVKLLEELGRKGDTVVTQSQYVFEFPYEPSPVPPCELILLHTLRKVRGCPPLSPAVVVLTASAVQDHDGTHVITQTSVDPSKYSKGKGKNRGQVHIAGLVLTPVKSGRHTDVTYVCVIKVRTHPKATALRWEVLTRHVAPSMRPTSTCRLSRGGSSRITLCAPKCWRQSVSVCDEAVLLRRCQA